ncbi:MAG TPA: TerC/Alx family metal homeostasis membrane protein [Acidisarcina sp.]
MFAAAPASYWICFHLVIAALLFIDLVVLQRRRSAPSAAMAWGWTGFVAVLAACFALFLWHAMGSRPALEFSSGYLIEGSMSVDNLFVFLLMFRALGLSREEQRRALLWGVLGAIVMRALFITLGLSLLIRFEWIQYLFGAVLLIAAIRLMRPHKPGKPAPSRLMNWLRKKHSRGAATPTHPTDAAAGQHDGVAEMAGADEIGKASEAAGKVAPRLEASSLLFVILAIEVTDLIFALDSIPAVMAITRNPFIVYTSNIFAILGLRSLFFALSHLLDRLRLLHYGLAVILAFVALKMLLSRWLQIPVGVSLVVILAILGIFIVASMAMGPPADGHRGHTAPVA